MNDQPNQMGWKSSIEPKHFGSGWISGVLSAILGALGLGAVLCFHYPSQLTVPLLREYYPVPYIRAALHIVLLGAFVLGAISVCLRQTKSLGMCGLGLTLIAALLGGSQVKIEDELRDGAYLGLDWFLLRIILFSAVFIPIERLFAHRPEQPVFRRGWRTDLAYFFVGSLLVQVITLVTMKPAMIFFQWAAHPELQAWVKRMPLVLQVAGILTLTDFTQYWVHRVFHSISVLWRIHAVHHSAQDMDWLAGSRLHLVDIAVTRGLTYIPIYVLGFDEVALYTYVAFVSIQATFIHANVRFEFGPLRWLIVTPQFHHWHHSAAEEAINKNFAVHLPVLDWLFGTYFMPDGQWPKSYGINGAQNVPDGYLNQFVHPFTPEQDGHNS